MASAETNGNSTDKLDFTTFHNVINGKLVGSSKTRHGINPATKKPLAEVPIATQEDVDNAVAAARAAFKTWSKTSLEERVAAINAYAQAFVALHDDFANLITTEMGRPVSITSKFLIPG
jgi:acyl-CoA reductase-like NAD-dependent aldehyde dehydrogenase